MSRTIRKPYTKSRAFDCQCRNAGSCSWCRGNRLIQETKAKQSAKDKEREGYVK